MTYKKQIPLFPSVPFVCQFDYYNRLARIFVKFTSTRSLDAVRGYFFGLLDSTQLASSLPEVVDSSTQEETL